MPKPNRPKLYWKDALRQVRLEPEEKEPLSTQKWSRAYRQAQADLTGPEAIVWLPDEIIALLREEAEEEVPEPPNRRGRLPAWLLTVLLLVPIALSYLLAYRRIAPHLR